MGPSFQDYLKHLGAGANKVLNPIFDYLNTTPDGQQPVADMGRPVVPPLPGQEHPLISPQARQGSVPQQVQPQVHPRVPTHQQQMLQIESSGNYGAVNQFGYTGGYQFGRDALVDMGYIKPDAPKGNGALTDPSNWTGKDGIRSVDDFKQNKEAQDQVYGGYRDKNAQYLKQIHGIDVSTLPQNEADALLSVAHKHGHVAAAKVFRGEAANPDGNGVDPQATYKQFGAEGEVPTANVAATQPNPIGQPEAQPQEPSNPILAGEEQPQVQPQEQPSNPLFSSPQAQQPTMHTLLQQMQEMKQQDFKKAYDLYLDKAIFGEKGREEGRHIADMYMKSREGVYNAMNPNNQSKHSYMQFRDVLDNPDDPTQKTYLTQMIDTNPNGRGTYWIDDQGREVTPELLKQYEKQGYTRRQREDVWKESGLQDAKVRGEKAAAWLDGVESHAEQAYSDKSKIDHALTLLDQTYSGTGQGVIEEVNKMAVSMGLVSPDSNASTELLRNIFHDFVEKRMNESAGALSDMEMNLFQSVSPNLRNTREGNRQLLEMYRKYADRAIHQERWIRRYLSDSPGKTARDAKKAWGNYRDERLQPIITADSFKPQQKQTGGLAQGIKIISRPQ